MSMNIKKLRLTNTAWTVIFGILISVFIWFGVDSKWSDGSLFEQVRATTILGLWLALFFAIIGVALVFFKSSRVLVYNGRSFTWAKRDIDRFDVKVKRAGRSAILPYDIIPHDGYRAMMIDVPGKGERGGLEVVAVIPKDGEYKRQENAMLEHLGDNLVIHSKDRTAYIGEDAHAELGDIWDCIITYGNTIGAKYGDDTIVYLSEIPNERVIVSDRLLDKLMQLSEARTVYGKKVAEERRSGKRLRREIESEKIRSGDHQPNTNRTVDDVRSPKMETE